MNRRKFLSILGLAPVAACSAALPAIAMPKPDDAKGAVTVKLELDTTEFRNMIDEIARDQETMLENG